MGHIDAETRLDFYAALERFMNRYGADTSRALKNEYLALKLFMISPVVANRIDAREGQRIVVFYEFEEWLYYSREEPGPRTKMSNHETFDYYSMGEYADSFLEDVKECSYGQEIIEELEDSLTEKLENLQVGESYEYFYYPDNSDLRGYHFKATFVKKNLTPPDEGAKERLERKRELFADIHEELLAVVMSPDRLARLGKDSFLGNLC